MKISITDVVRLFEVLQTVGFRATLHYSMFRV